MTLFTNGTITLPDNRTLAFGEYGKGDPLLLLHGNPGDRDDWTEVVKNLGDRGFRCLAVDRPGHGKSSPLRPEPGATAAAYATLLRSSEGEKAVVVGYSMGAHFALDLAERYPDLVKGVGLIAPYLLPWDETEKPSGLPGLLDLPLIGSFIGFLLPFMAAGKIRQHVESMFNPEKPPAGVVDRLSEKYTTLTALSGLFRDKNIFFYTYKDVNAAIGGIKCPVLLITGAEDAISGTASAELVKNALPDILHSDVPRGGHALLWTQASHIAEKILGK